MALTAKQASALAMDARKYIHVAASLWPVSIVNITVGDIHKDIPTIQIRIEKLYKYKAIYIPCVILGGQTKLYERGSYE